MPPKAAKRGSDKKPSASAAAVVNKNWEAGLTRAQFEEDSWQACVSLVVGRNPEDEELAQTLSLAVQKPLRKLFSGLTWDSTLAKIHELGNPKAKRSNDVPTFYEVTESAKVLLDAGEEIPCDLMAKILKFQLLQIKAKDQQRRADQLKSEEEKNPVSKESGEKRGKNPVSPVTPSKEKTKLKRRDDVEPLKFIDDEPQDGPQHYILLFGFLQPHLVRELDAIGVHVANVIQLQRQQPCGDDDEQSASLGSDAKAEVGGAEEMAAQARKLKSFWSGLRPVLDTNSKLHDVVQLSYTVPDLWPPCHTGDPEAELEMGTQIFGGVANLIYDCLEWRLQHQHYLANMKVISVPTVLVLDPEPAETKPVQEERQTNQEPERPLTTDVDMRYYGNLLDLVPPEACSVPLIMHCMLEQVVISSEQCLSTPSYVAEEVHDAPGLDYQLVSSMLQSFLPLVGTEEEKSHMLNSLVSTAQNEEDIKRLVKKFGTEEKQKKPERPLVIRHHDEMGLRLKNISAVQGFDPAEVELSMMRHSPVWELIQSVAQQKIRTTCWMALKQQLHHFCTDDVVSWLEVERLIHQSVFECMPLTRLDRNGVLNAPGPVGTLEPAQQQTPVIIPWDDPLTYAKQQHNLQKQGLTFLTGHPGHTEINGRANCQLDLADIQSFRLRSLFDWHYAEHHSASIFPQVLQLASEEYRCLDTLRVSHNNTLYIFCHNPMSPYRQSKEFWDVALHTEVKFRKYLEHVACRLSDWLKEEESKTEAEQLRNLSPVESPEEGNASDSAEKEDTLEPVIRKGSLKAWKLMQEQPKEEELGKRSKKENIPKSMQQKEEVDKKRKALSGGKMITAESADSSVKTPPESIPTTAPPVEETKEVHLTEEPFNGFTGYSVDGKLIRVSGCRQDLFPSDGGHIIVENVSYVEGSSLMKIAVKKDGHRFCTHVNQGAVDPKPPPQPEDNKTDDRIEDVKVSEPEAMERVKCGSLSAVLDNGIHLSYSFYGPTGQYRGPQETEQGAHSSPFKSLNLSVPNGLVLQFLQEETPGVSAEEQGMLVRQSFPLHGRGVAGKLQDPSLSNELSRIVTSQGAVIRSMRDRSTEVLFADGSVSFSQDSGPVWVPDSEVQEENGSKETENKEKEAQKGHWLTTTPSGARISTVGTTHKHIPTTPLLTFKAMDPITHEVMLSREDLVVFVHNKDGSVSVEHADGTRITTLYQNRPPRAPSSIDVPAPTPKSTSECACGSTECVCADSINENMQQHKGSVSTKERVVLVEKEGCATVVMYPERHTAHVFLADGTVITGSNQGAYQVFPSSVGLLDIQSDGKCVYFSEPPLTPSPNAGTPTKQPGSYVMSHTDKVACDVTDPEGNHFQVMEDGELSVSSCSTSQQDEEEDREMSRIHANYREHCPRLFLAHEDGSGTELLSSQTVEDVLHQAHSDPATALEKEPLPDTPDGFGITILKPSHQSVWSKWLLGKQHSDITPPNLRNRSWHDFPRLEKKTPGCPFGTNAGRGLTLTERPGGSANQRKSVKSCPEVLEIRELYQYQPFTPALRDTVDTRLKGYIESLMEREQRSEDMKVKDPRTEEESAHASELLNLVLSFAEEEAAGCTFYKTTSVDVASLYSRGVGALAEQSDVSENTVSVANDSFAHGKESKWTVRLAQHRQEMHEQQERREALRKRTVVPFFHPENIPLHQNLLQHEKPDMTSLSMNLPPIPKSDSAAAFLKDAPQENTAPRPLNPTPSQSASHAGRSDRTLKKRPTNRPPQTAGENSPTGSSGQSKSVQLDVTAKLKRTKVRLPNYMLSSKPRSLPNQWFLSVEEPVRRKCRTVSLTDPSIIIRGFHLLPSSVDFGTLQEGTSSAVTVAMKNVGVDTCRFHVKQPPPASGLRVVYSPGPVAAGLHVELQVQLFAMCAIQAGELEPKTYISQDIIIYTETDILYLPVTATILPERLYDLWLRDRSSTHKKGSRVRQLSSSLSAGRASQTQ